MGNRIKHKNWNDLKVKLHVPTQNAKKSRQICILKNEQMSINQIFDGNAVTHDKTCCLIHSLTCCVNELGKHFLK